VSILQILVYVFGGLAAVALVCAAILAAFPEVE